MLTDDKTAKRRPIRAAPSIVRPEVLVVVDGSLYKRIGKNASSAKKYIINFLTKIDQRFRCLSNPRVELHLADIVILESTASPPYLSRSILPHTYNGSSVPAIHATKALDLMGKHYYNADMDSMPNANMDIMPNADLTFLSFFSVPHTFLPEGVVLGL